MKHRDDNYDNVVNIDGSRYREGKEVKRPNRGLIYKLTPEVIGAGILVLIFLYLIVNVLIYRSKKQVSIFEVQTEQIGYETSFKGICLRDEKLVSAQNSGYLNYYIAGGSKVAKNGTVYSVSTSDTISGEINKNYEELKLDSGEISRIKNIIYTRMHDYNGSDLGWVEGFEKSLNSVVYEMINENVLETALALRENSGSSGFFTYKSDESGIISYTTDSMTGYKVSDVTADSFEMKDADKRSLRTAGMIAAGEPVYRICDNDNWTVIAKVSEDFYLNNLEERNATIYLNGDDTPITGTLKLYMIDKDYFAEIDLSKYMIKYMNDRFVKVEFEKSGDSGLKIPVSAIFKKEFYLVPLSMFVETEGYNGYVLCREIYDAGSGKTTYENIYPEKYYSDGYYAYIETDKLNEGDYLVNNDTGERLRVGLINYLEGVYNVNKGYYIFVRIEKLRSNNEYAIIKSNTPDGIRQYDHIALNASDAVDQALIY